MSYLSTRDVENRIWRFPERIVGHFTIPETKYLLIIMIIDLSFKEEHVCNYILNKVTFEMVSASYIKK